MHRQCCSTAMTPFGNYGGNYWGLEPTRNLYCPDIYSHSPIAVLENSFRDMDNQFRQLRREMDSVFRSLLGLDQVALDFKPEVVTEGDKKKYYLNVPVGRFRPENVKVSVKDRVMTVEAKVEEKSEDGKRRFYQEVSRQFTLPENVDLKEVKSLLTPEGVLKVEAPLPLEALPEPPKPQEIPIHLE